MDGEESKAKVYDLKRLHNIIACCTSADGCYKCPLNDVNFGYRMCYDIWKAEVLELLHGLIDHQLDQFVIQDGELYATCPLTIMQRIDENTENTEDDRETPVDPV